MIDASGNPITDLTSGDFAIREDGVDCEVLTAKRATEPLNVALLADTSTAAEKFVPEMRAGFKTFIDTALKAAPESQLSLWEFGQAAVRIENFTSDGEALGKTAGRLFPKPRAASVLLEALYDTSQALAGRPSPRRAIIVVNIEPADEQSRQEPQRINESLLRSRASLWPCRCRTEAGKRDAGPGVEYTRAQCRRPTGVHRRGIGPRELHGPVCGGADVAVRDDVSPLVAVAKIVQTGVRREGARVIAGIAAPQ